MGCLLVDGVEAAASVEAGRGLTLVDVHLTVVSAQTRRTHTSVTVDAVFAGRVVLTRVRLALINVHTATVTYRA